MATALQMISWGLEVNDYGNALLDEQGNFVKVEGQGVTEDMWRQMVAYAQANGLKAGNYKKLNLPFENKLLGQPLDIRERMVRRVEDFAYHLMVNVFNAAETAPLAVQTILASGSCDPGPKAERIEDPAEWIPEKIVRRARSIPSTKGPDGNFED